MHDLDHDTQKAQEHNDTDKQKSNFMIVNCKHKMERIGQVFW